MGKIIKKILIKGVIWALVFTYLFFFSGYPLAISQTKAVITIIVGVGAIMVVNWFIENYFARRK
jgi:hypothetical protein